MASQALYRKWRSQTFDEVVGQEHITQTLMNALKLDRVAHAYLFAGPRGTGKTSTARLLAKAVNCQAEDPGQRPCNVCRICVAVNEGRLLDLIEIDAASNTGVDDIRDLRDKVNFRPGEARIKFYIIDEVHMLSNSAFNALLKTLEEPPGHVIFVLATTEPEKIPATITSRCQRFDFKRIKLADVTARLAYIVDQEGLAAEPAALTYIARQGGGSMRDAISLLDQLTAYGGEKITLDLVQRVLGVVASQTVVELTGALINQDVAMGLDIINRVVNDGADPRQFAREMVEYLRAVMLVKLGDGMGLLNLPEETLVMIRAQAAQAAGPEIIRATTLFNNALVDLKSGLLAIPQLPLELAFIEAVTPTVVMSIAAEPAPPAPPTKAPLSKIDTPPSPSPKEVSSIEEMRVTEGPGLSLEMVQKLLPQIVKEVEPKNKTMAVALHNDTHLYRVVGKEIHFITSDFMKARFEKPQPRTVINDAFSKVIGQSVTVHFLSEKTVPAGTPLSTTEAPQSESGEAITDKDADALLKMAEDLGGKVIK